MNAQMSATELALVKQIAELKAALAAKSQPKGLSIKVSAKGAISIYGMGRWPVTLYRGQMERLMAHKDDVLAFIEEHAAELAVKAD